MGEWVIKHTEQRVSWLSCAFQTFCLIVSAIVCLILSHCVGGIGCVTSAIPGYSSDSTFAPSSYGGCAIMQQAESNQNHNQIQNVGDPRITAGGGIVKVTSLFGNIVLNGLIASDGAQGVLQGHILVPIGKLNGSVCLDSSISFLLV